MRTTRVHGKSGMASLVADQRISVDLAFTQVIPELFHEFDFCRHAETVSLGLAQSLIRAPAINCHSIDAHGKSGTVDSRLAVHKRRLIRGIGDELQEVHHLRLRWYTNVNDGKSQIIE